MPNRRHLVIGLQTLNRAVGEVSRELQQLGIWNRLVDVPLRRIWLGGSLGYYTPRGQGADDVIEIPAISLGRIGGYVRGFSKTSLRDIIRHEYGHAFAYRHRRLIRSRWFRLVFGLPHDAEQASTYDPACHVSEYAATRPYEDFAEVFMCYLRHRGRMSSRFQCPRIAAKWQFVRIACGQAGEDPTAWSGRSMLGLRAAVRLATA